MISCISKDEVPLVLQCQNQSPIIRNPDSSLLSTVVIETEVEKMYFASHFVNKLKGLSSVTLVLHCQLSFRIWTQSVVIV
jgi:hypothetical protein